MSEPAYSTPLGAARAWGAAGSLFIALGAMGAGAGPADGPFARPDVPFDLFDAGIASAYFGLILLATAWWRLGKLCRAARPPRVDEVLTTLAMWAAPLVVAPPMFSRDVYSYLAQGAMVGNGIDVYHYGPAALSWESPASAFAAEVPQMWQDTPTPYGPAFLLLAAIAAALVGGDVTVGVLAMRLVALLGVALLAVSLPDLARRFGVAPAAALWLAVLNPLVLIHFIGGAHNDAVMAGLLAAGLAAAAARRPIVGAVAVTAAALVKAPAAVGLVAVALIWAGQSTDWWRRLRAFGGTALVSVGTATAVTAAAGTGFGWVGALLTPVTSHNWSLTSAMGRATGALLDKIGADVGAQAVTVWRWAGLCAALVTAVLVWLRRHQLGPVHALGVVLGAVVIFGPAIRPWYLLWAVVPLAAAAPHSRSGRFVAAACAVLALVVLPDGFAPDLRELGFAVLGGCMAVALLVAVAVARQPDDDFAAGFAR